MNEQREEIAEVLSAEKRRSHTRQMIGGITAATWDETDAVIAHLWQAADDPEVTDLVDDIVSIHGMSRTESRGIVDDVVAALIGERPESEATE